MKIYTTKIDLSDFEIEELISKLNDKAHFGNVYDEEMKESVFTYRRSKVRVFRYPYTDTLLQKIENIIINVAEDIFYKDDIIETELQITEYDESYEGKYDWHEDVANDTSEPIGHRIISFSIQLSDSEDYQGGDLEFKDSEINSLSRDKLSMVLFESDIVHRVTPVTKGTRYSMVGWLMGLKNNGN